MDHGAIITMLGNPTKLAARLGLPVVSCVGHWRARGIPLARFSEIAALLREEGVELSFEEFLSGRPAPKPRRTGRPVGRPSQQQLAEARAA